MLPDGLFHVTARGVARDPIFHDGIDYAEFERQLYRISDEYDWTLHAYCLLPNHYHLIVDAKRGELSTGMHKLNGRYAQRFNRRYDCAGHVFQNRFDSYVIDSEEHFLRALARLSACKEAVELVVLSAQLLARGDVESLRTASDLLASQLALLAARDGPTKHLLLLVPCLWSLDWL